MQSHPETDKSCILNDKYLPELKEILDKDTISSHHAINYVKTAFSFLVGGDEAPQFKLEHMYEVLKNTKKRSDLSTFSLNHTATLNKILFDILKRCKNIEDSDKKKEIMDFCIEMMSTAPSH